jgi:hypothetical protein
MIQSVVAIPMATLGHSPELSIEASWVQGPLGRIDSSGAPAKSVLDLVNDELPLPLRSTLNRQSVDLWDSPLEVNSGLNIVGLEYVLADSDIASEILLIHFAGLHKNTNLDLVSSVTRLNQSSTKDLLRQFLALPSTNLLMSRGIAVSVIESSSQDQIIAGDMTLELTADFGVAKFAHGRVTHLLTVCASQYFGLCFLNIMWPAALNDKSALDEFQEKFREFRHVYEWPEVSTDQHSRVIYRNLRAMLGTEGIVQNYAEELRDNYTAIDAQNSRRLNQYGLYVAGLALVPAWITLKATRFGGVALSALCLVGAVALIGAFWRKRR